MPEKKKVTEGYQPVKKGYQPEPPKSRLEPPKGGTGESPKKSSDKKSQE